MKPGRAAYSNLDWTPVCVAAIGTLRFPCWMRFCFKAIAVTVKAEASLLTHIEPGCFLAISVPSERRHILATKEAGFYLAVAIL